MYWQKMNQISYQKEAKLISKKGLTKDLINKYKILNGVFFSDVLRKYLVFSGTTKIYS